MVPEGWIKAPTSKFGDVCAGRQRSPHFINGTSRFYLRVANVFDGYIDVSDINSMKFTDTEFNKYRLKFGDILLNEGQSSELVGRAAMYQGIPAESGFQNTLIRFRAGNLSDPYYALQRFRLCLYDGTFQSISKKTTSIAHLGVSRFAELELSWPPISEQRKIAKILSIWDQSVAATEKLLEKSLQQKKGLMQQLLNGKRRLPGFTDDWKQISFGSAFRERSETGWDSLRLLSITSEDGVIDREDTGRKDTSNADKSKYLRILPGDIGYNTMRMWQGVSGLSDLEGLVSPAYTVLTPQEYIDPLYAAYLFKLPALVHVFYRHSQGLVSDTWNLKYRNFSKIKWCVPGVNEQKAIANVLSVSDREIRALKAKLNCVKQEKKYLMQQLLTGKRRVKVDQQEFA